MPDNVICSFVERFPSPFFFFFNIPSLRALDFRFECFLLSFLVISGPFKINGVPLRRVNQAYVIGTSTKVDVSGVNMDKFDDKYFAKEVQKKKKKGEGEFFEAEKEVGVFLH